MGMCPYKAIEGLYWDCLRWAVGNLISWVHLLTKPQQHWDITHYLD